MTRPPGTIALVDAWQVAEARDFFVRAWPMYVHELSGFDTDFYTLDAEGRWQPDIVQDWIAPVTPSANLREGHTAREAAQPFQRAHVIVQDRRPVGFVCIGLSPFKYMPDDVDLSIAEMFLIHASRGTGTGESALALLFARYPGRFELRAIHDNARAIAFWRRALPRLGAQAIVERSEHGDVTFRFRIGDHEHAQRTQRTYDAIAPQFLERTRSLDGPWVERFARALPPGSQVVDLGAGPCHLSAALRAEGLRVISVDRSAAMLRVAQHEYPGPRVQADLRCLPFRAASLDGIWANASLLHLDREELAPALRELRRVLVASGLLHLTLKHGEGGGWDRSKYSPDAPRWFTYFTEAEVDAALQAAGFSVEEGCVEAGKHDTWIIRVARARENAP